MTLNNDFGSSACHKPKGIYCHECKEYTQSIEPILIRRYNKQIFAIVAVCKKFDNTKQCSMSDGFYEKFPLYYFDIKLSKFYINEIKDKNGIKHKLDKDLFYLINEPLSRSY